MNLQQLKYFQTVAREEHFTRASEILMITQPNLSHSIACLEEELGVPLFTRKGRNVELNRYGKVFLEYVNKSLNELEKGIENLKSLVNPFYGTINLGFTQNLGYNFIPNVIKKFYEIDNKNNVKFSFTIRNTSIISRYLNNGNIDIGFCSLIEGSNIKSTPIFKEELVLIVPKNHKFANRKSIDLCEAKNELFISYNHTSGLRRVLDEIFKKAGFKPKIVFEVEDDVSVSRFVSSGLGIAIIPQIPDLNSANYVKLNIINPSYERIIYMNWIDKEYISPPVKIFKDFVQSNFSLNI